MLQISEEIHQLQEEVVTIETTETVQQVEDSTNHMIDQIIEQGRKDDKNVEYDVNTMVNESDLSRHTGGYFFFDWIFLFFSW